MLMVFNNSHQLPDLDKIFLINKKGDKISKIIDLIGQKLNKLTVIERAENNKYGQACWRCICDCGNETIVNGHLLKSGHTKSCGRCAMADLTGKKFGRLTVIGRAENDKRGQYRWRCLCECGKETIVIADHLQRGHTKSCSCLRSEDLTGIEFGRLIVIGRAEIKKGGRYYWKCKCNCGNEIIVDGSHLRRGTTKSCGCIAKKEYGEAAFNRLYAKYKIHANEKEREFLLTDGEFKELIFSNCYYCGKEPLQVMRSGHSNGDIIYNGIDRIDSSQGYIKDNVRTCCKQCNFIKNKYSEVEFLLMVKNIYENLNLKSRVPDKIADNRQYILT